MPSEKSPLVLFHGVSSSGSAWVDTAALLAVDHKVLTPTALGHKGGSPVERRPVTIWDVVDDAERYLDEQGLDRPHLAGNSMGGFVALELGRRGRAQTVCALSPAGFWSPRLREYAIGRIRLGATMSRIGRPATNVLFNCASLRRLLLSSVACHPERMTAAQARLMVDDAVACSVAADLFTTDDQHIAPLDPLPCPVTIAWSEHDALFPLAKYQKAVSDRLPGASLVVLRGVGHVPMIDDPQLVARTILAVTGSATA